MSKSIYRSGSGLSLAFALALVFDLQAADGPLSATDVIQRVSNAMQANGSSGPFISPEFGMDDPLVGPAWGTQLAPSVAFNGTNYLVVWMDYRESERTFDDIYGARVTAAGVVLDPKGFPICKALGTRRNPVVAASGGDFLVAWHDERSSSALYVANVTAIGAVRQPDGVFIATFNGTHFKVAGNGTDYLLVWENFSPLNGYDILGAKLSGTFVNPGVPTFAISEQPGWERFPAVASSVGNYLVVWEDNRNSTGSAVDIYGARVNASGNVLEPNGFPISAGEWDETTPAVAGTPANYLVVWHDRRNDIYGDIYGARVSLAGALLDAGFPIGSNLDQQHSPKVTANANGYLVAWRTFQGPEFHVNPVSTAGTVANTEGFVVGSASIYSFGLAPAPDGFMLVWDDNGDVFGMRLTSEAVPVGGDFIITTGDNAQQAPAVAFNGTTYLVVWQDNRNPSDNIHGVRVAADGSILDQTAIPISNSGGWEYSPAVAALDGDFLVVWSDLRSGTSADIYGTRVRADGAVLDPPGIPISTHSYSQRAVAIAANADHYLVVWRDNRNFLTSDRMDDIFGARVTVDGAVLDPAGLAISEAPGPQEAPAVASNGDQFLVVWRDDRLGSPDANIYGALVTGAVVGPEAAISTAPAQQRGPEVSSDGLNFFVVWRDQRNFGASDFDIYGARVDFNGVVLDTNGLPICSAAGRQAEAAIAFGGINYFVTWQDFRTGGTTPRIFGTRVSPAGVVFDGSGLLINPGAMNDDILAIASSGSDNFLIVSEGFRGSAPRALANVVGYGDLPPPNDADPHALQNWRVDLSLSVTNDLFAVAAGGGRYVVGGSVGFTASSSNFVDWKTNLPVANRVEEIIYRPGLFVGVGLGQVFQSTNGMAWQVQGAPNLAGITYGNGRYVAVGTAGTYFTSTNLTNWTVDFMGTNATFLGVAHGNDKFVAVGVSGAIRISTNGLNWTAGISATNRPTILRGVTYAQGQFVAVGNDAAFPVTGAIWTSPNGTNWTVRTCPTTNTLQAVTYADYLFVAVGENGAILSSHDGHNWTVNNSGTSNYLYSVTYADGMVLAAGIRGTILFSDPLRYSAPRIVRQPLDVVTVFVGDDVTLSVAAIGTSPQYIQWFKDGEMIPGAIGETLMLADLQESDSGSYSVVVTNGYGSSITEFTEINAYFRVGIVQPPLNQSIVSGGVLAASVLVTGTPPYSFEWRHGPNVFSSNVTYDPFSFLLLSNVQAGGVYQVRVRNPAPFIGVGANFTVTLLADSDDDGLPDTWEDAYNFDANNPADAFSDSDMDGLHNLAEYQAGTDPTNSASSLRIDGTRLLPESAVTVDFEAISNRTYSLQGRPQLDIGSWTPVADIIARSSNRTVTITNTIALSPASRFYRLVTPRP